MATAMYANGRIPQSALDPIPAADGQTAWLLPGPAASFLRVAATCQLMHGWHPMATSAGDGFRSELRQVNVFNERYDPQPDTSIRGPYSDVRWWKGVRYVRMRGPAAAVPGTSNHGLGITVDITELGGYSGRRFAQIKPLLTAEGWSNVEGSRIGEAWHWNYLRTAYPVVDTNQIPGVDITIPNVTGHLPDPLNSEDDMTPDERADLNLIKDNVSYIIRALQGGTGLEAVVSRVREDGAAVKAATAGLPDFVTLSTDNIAYLVRALQTPDTGLEAVVSQVREDVAEVKAAVASLAQGVASRG